MTSPFFGLHCCVAFVDPSVDGCFGGKKPGRCPLATGHFAPGLWSGWSPLNTMHCTICWNIHWALLVAHIKLLALRWGQELAWGWFAPISASSLHYILITVVSAGYYVACSGKLSYDQHSVSLCAVQGVQCNMQRKYVKRTNLLWILYSDLQQD